jgi:hypothetical protein
MGGKVSARGVGLAGVGTWKEREGIFSSTTLLLPLYFWYLLGLLTTSGTNNLLKVTHLVIQYPEAWLAKFLSVECPFIYDSRPKPYLTSYLSSQESPWMKYLKYISFLFHRYEITESLSLAPS